MRPIPALISVEIRTVSQDSTHSDVPFAEPAWAESGDRETTRKQCPNCHSHVPSRTDACPSCGRTVYGDSSAGLTSGTGYPRWLTVVLASMALLIGLTLFVVNSESNQAPPSSPDQAPEGVSYRVVADGPVSVTFRDRNGNVAQRVNVPTPWTYPDDGETSTFVPDGEQYVQIAAQKTDWKKPGRIRVQIIVNGKVWKQDRCSGKYCMVSQDGLYRKSTN